MLYKPTIAARDPPSVVTLLRCSREHPEWTTLLIGAVGDLHELLAGGETANAEAHAGEDPGDASGSADVFVIGRDLPASQSDPAGLDSVLRQVVSSGAASQAVQLPLSRVKSLAAQEATAT